MKPHILPDLQTDAERREFLRRVCSTALLGAGAVGVSGCSSTAAGLGEDAAPAFAHGVASGDPLADRVILWTRVTPGRPEAQDDIAVRWQVATDRAMQHIVASGGLVAVAAQDYTVKVDAAGLLPGHVYYYQFAAAAAKSPVARTRTLPKADARQVRLAVFSCSNYPAGYFNVYADAARLDDIDAALHIGDYLYEYESTGYASEKAVELGRVSEPRGVLLELGDYRRRYAQYRADPDLQAIHAAVPFIAVWDDHEIADDTWRESSIDHDSKQMGPFSARKAAAMQAYHEWMPIRLPDPERPDLIYRSFDFGRLVSLHMLDTRTAGRDQQLTVAAYFDSEKRFDAARYKAELGSVRREMLGGRQMAWLEGQVTASQSRWQMLGQQVLMARMDYPAPVVLGECRTADFMALKERAARDPGSVTPKETGWLAAGTLPCYLDSWDGYQNDREQVFQMMQRQRKNLVVLAGDTHNAWASDLRDAAGVPVGVEFAAPSVSSPGMEGSYPNMTPEQVSKMMVDMIEPLYYAETSKRGYMVVTATHDQVRCDWRFVDTVHSRAFTAATERSLRTLAGPGNRTLSELA